MKEYPSIPSHIDRDLLIYAFDKIDGSNVRAEWSRKTGFYKFGSRQVLIDDKHPFLGESIGLIRTKYEEGLSKVFTKNRLDRVICFFEFYGPNSFAGNHADEAHDVVLIDVNPHKRGIDPPTDFIHRFGHLKIPRCLYVGKANYEFEESVRLGALPGMTFEGVVCKGVRKGRHLTMFKIKSQAWLDKLKIFCKGDDRLYLQMM